MNVQAPSLTGPTRVTRATFRSRLTQRLLRSLTPANLYIVAISVVFVVLWRGVFEGHVVLVGGDILQGLPPWHLAGPVSPPRNAFVSDPISQFLPWLTVVRNAYAHGSLPLWNSSDFSGAPMLADDQSAPFSPFTIIALAFSPATGYSLAMLAKLVVACAGTALWVRQLGARRLAATLAGLAFATSSFMVVWLGHPQTAVAAIFPWAFAALEWYLRTRRRRALLCFALAIALQFLAGHAEATLDLGVLLAFYAVIRVAAQTHGRWRAGGSLMLAGVMGTALAGTQLVPFIAELHATTLLASRASAQAGSAHLPLRTLATWLIPNGLGNPGIDGMLGRPPNYLESTGFVGVGALLLAPLGLIFTWRRRRSIAIALGLAALLLVGVIYGVLSPVVAHLPVLRFANSVRLLVDLCLVLSVLAGLGLSGLMDLRTSARRALVHAARVVFAAGVASLVLLLAMGLLLSQRGAAVDTLLPKIHGEIGFWVVAALLSIVAAGSFIAVMLAGSLRVLGAAGLAMLALLEGAIFAGPFQPRVPSGDVPPTSPAIAWLQSHAGGSAVAAQGLILLPDTAAFYGLRDARGVDLTFDPRERLYWSHADPGYDDASLYTVLSRPRTAWLAAAGVRYYISQPGAAPPGSRAALVEPAFTVSMIPGSRPFAFSASDVRGARGSSDAARELAADPLGPVVVETAGAGPPSGAASVTVMRRDPGDVELRVNAAAPATVVVLQSYSPDWVATVDGARKTLMPADVLFQAVQVPQGIHAVALEYRPASVTEGSAISLVAVALLLLALMAVPLVVRRIRAGAP